MPWLLLALTRAMLVDVHVAQVGSPPATLPKAALSSGSAEIVSSIGDVVIHQLTCFMHDMWVLRSLPQTCCGGGV